MSSPSTTQSASRKHELTSNQFLGGLTHLDIDVTKFTPDAIELLRICHKEFIALVSSEIEYKRASNSRSSDNAKHKPIQDIEVEACLKELHFETLLSDARKELGMHNLISSGTKKSATTRKRKKKISDDAFREQEHMLAQSAKSFASASDSQIIIGVQGIARPNNESDIFRPLDVDSILKQE